MVQNLGGGECNSLFFILDLVLCTFTMNGYNIDNVLSPFCGITKEMMSRGPQVADMECREIT